MFTGLMSPLVGAGFLIKNKSLLKYLAVPLAINSAIFSFFLYFVATWFPEAIGSFLPKSDGSLVRMAYYALLGLSYALLLLVSVGCFSIIGNIIASPFTDLLTQRVEDIVLGNSTAEGGFSLGDLMRILWTLGEELKRLAFLALIFIVLLPLNLFPVVGQMAYLCLNGLVVSLFLGLEFFSYSLDRRSYSFRQKLRFIRKRFFQVLGVGTSAWVLLLIPLVNFTILPLAAVGATLCFCSVEGEKEA